MSPSRLLCLALLPDRNSRRRSYSILRALDSGYNMFCSCSHSSVGLHWGSWGAYRRFRCSSAQDANSHLQEKPVMFRRYVTLHILITVAAFSVAAVWAIISATRHSTAKQNCITNFFPDEASRSQGDLLCEIFPWVDVGIMGGLWLLLLAVHVCSHHQSLSETKR